MNCMKVFYRCAIFNVINTINQYERRSFRNIQHLCFKLICRYCLNCPFASCNEQTIFIFNKFN